MIPDKLYTSIQNKQISDAGLDLFSQHIMSRSSYSFVPPVSTIHRIYVLQPSYMLSILAKHDAELILRQKDNSYLVEKVKEALFQRINIRPGNIISEESKESLLKTAMCHCISQFLNQTLSFEEIEQDIYSPKVTEAINQKLLKIKEHRDKRIEK